MKRKNKKKKRKLKSFYNNAIKSNCYKITPCWLLLL